MSAAPARGTARSTRPLQSRGPATARERALRVVAPTRSRARQAPFVLVVIAVLSAGLVGLVVTNTALQDQAFRLASLQQQASSLRVEQERLQRAEDRRSSPAALAEAAVALGMVPNAAPVFLRPSTGEVVGVPVPAEAGSNVLGGQP